MAFHNDRILMAKILSFILDDLNRTLVYFYMSFKRIQDCKERKILLVTKLSERIVQSDLKILCQITFACSEKESRIFLNE